MDNDARSNKVLNTDARRTPSAGQHHTLGVAGVYRRSNTMNTNLPPVIAAFFRAHNTGQTADFNQLFAVNALVTDEAHEYRGAAIQAWIDGATARYKPVADITDLTVARGQTIATALVSGNFPGSPAQIRYKFTLKDDKIAALAIGS